MRAPVPPAMLTRLQIKREAEARMIAGTETNLWVGVLRPALQADADVWEEWGMTQEIRFDDPIVDVLAGAMLQAEDTGETLSVYKDHFWREAAARTRG